MYKLDDLNVLPVGQRQTKVGMVAQSDIVLEKSSAPISDERLSTANVRGREAP